MSGDRIDRLSASMQRYVDDGHAAGIVTLVARAGYVVHHSAFGLADVEAGRAMQPDTIFRIASQTKALTSVAAMMLVEEGRLALDDPLQRYLPEYASTQVGRVPANGEPSQGGIELVSASRPIRIRDLLTHTSGISYGFGVAAEEWRSAGAQGGYYADRNETMARLVERIASLPMQAQPGMRFVYGNSTDVLGVVVEVASGMKLDEFFRQRITGPLGMKDTHFFLPADQRARLAAVYAALPSGLRRGTGPTMIDGQGHFIDGPRKAHAGGSGLVSTAADYGRFLQMLLNRGEFNGVRLLSPTTIDLMTVNHVGDLFEQAVPDRPGYGFGLGFAVLMDPGKSGHHGSPGSYGFAGAYYTSYWVDPQQQMLILLMVQLRPPRDTSLQTRFRTLAYQAIVAPPPLRGAEPAALSACVPLK
jgi:CubicO group peptidase (beta-lactamase class C family)